MKRYLLYFSTILTLNAYGQLGVLEQSRIDEVFKTWNSPSSPGMALGIIKDGKLTYSKGYGMADLEHDVPITDSTIFYIGSVSKQFVTMSILLLEEQGKLGLDDRVQKYLPDFPEYSAPLTIRHFIHHTSGVRDNLTLWELAGNDVLDHIDKEEMYQLIRRQKELNFIPGAKVLYSNSCYFMLALIIEKVSGESLKQFAQKNIFGPLGMRSTFFQDDNTRIIKNRAFSYLGENGQFKNQIMRFDLIGSGGIYSNIKDLYLWDQNFYHNKLGKASQALIDKMHTDGVLNNGKSAGNAFAIINSTYRGLKTAGHSGSLAGYRSYLFRFPEQKTSIIILANTPVFFGKLANSVADVILEKQLSPLPTADNGTTNNAKVEKKAFRAENVKRYTGAFYSEDLDVTYHVTENSNELSCSIKGRKPVALIPISQDLFSMIGDVKLKFEKNSKNQIAGFSVNAGRVTDLKFKRK